MKRLSLFLVSSLLLLGVAACAQREKPPVPTPTLSTQGVLPASATDTPVALPSPLGTGQPVPQGTAQAQGTLPPSFVATAGPPPLATPTSGSAAAQPTNPPSAQATSAPESPVTSGGACTNPYVVARGEWAYQIARKCGTTYNALQAANATVNLAVVYPGQNLNLPGGGSTTPPGNTGGHRYVVRFGDTLYSIAARFGTTAYAIQLANRLANPNFIWVGESLIIP